MGHLARRSPGSEIFRWLGGPTKPVRLTGVLHFAFGCGAAGWQIERRGHLGQSVRRNGGAVAPAGGIRGPL